MRGKSKTSVLKRQREVAKRERAERKRARKAQRHASGQPLADESDLASYGLGPGADETESDTGPEVDQ